MYIIRAYKEWSSFFIALSKAIACALQRRVGTTGEGGGKLFPENGNSSRERRVHGCLSKWEWKPAGEREREQKNREAFWSTSIVELAGRRGALGDEPRRRKVRVVEEETLLQLFFAFVVLFSPQFLQEERQGEGRGGPKQSYHPVDRAL